MFKKSTLLLLFLVISVYAKPLQWLDSYEKAVPLAKAQNKNIMLLVTSKTCGWCRKLERVTLEDEMVIERLEEAYIVVHVTRGEGKYPQKLQVGPVPATFFLNAEGELIIDEVIGYWPPQDYLSYLDDVDYKLGKKEY